MDLVDIGPIFCISYMSLTQIMKIWISSIQWAGMKHGITIYHFIFRIRPIFRFQTWKSTICWEKLFGRQPGVAWQAFFFQATPTLGFLRPMFVICGFECGFVCGFVCGVVDCDLLFVDLLICGL